ncbi:MAG: substrate-binding domain-containing protein, partial [Chloroflexota bacterium]|nr:substrate-binding domain-containing protein [Chloroflexota bacterium]
MHTPNSLYIQIAEQLKTDIATAKVLPGDRLPTVRELARKLKINPGTVARAYGELERDGIVQTRRGGGTYVVPRTNSKALDTMREDRLSTIFNRSILEGLGLGYSPEELEAIFTLQLTKWREERIRDNLKIEIQNKTTDRKSIVFLGSHDMAIEILATHLRQKHPSYTFSSEYVGSMEGLFALRQNKAHLCGIHLLDEDSGEYNTPYIKNILVGQPVVVINLACRLQGLLTTKKNPKDIRGIQDLVRNDVTIINRQRGSGTRMLLDYKLKESSIDPQHIRGYDQEVDTHLSVASSIASGTADVGLGIEAAAQALNLDFIPVAEERYDLVIPKDYYSSSRLRPLVEVITSEKFRMALSALRGYQ